MSDEEPTVWGIHGGRAGEAESLFLHHSVVALGWHKVGDLSTLGPDREQLKARVASVYPEMKSGAVPVVAGQLFRFVHEMRDGDVVALPSKRDKTVHLGLITGPYAYDSSGEPSYPHRRAAQWKKQVSRLAFSQGALYEMGATMTLFQVKTYAAELLKALHGNKEPVAILDETIPLVAEEIAQNTRDFILKRLAQDLKGHPFAEFVAHLLRKMGYRTRVSTTGPDHGVDIVAHKDELGFEPPLVRVQVKSGETSDVGEPQVAALYGNVGANEFGLLVTLGRFSPQARMFAHNKGNLRLVDGDELVELVLSHYDKLDSKYKGVIPLKQVYVPEAVEEAQE